MCTVVQCTAVGLRHSPPRRQARHAFMQNCIKIVCRTWLSPRSSIGETSSGWTFSRSPSVWCPGRPPSGPVWLSVWCSHCWAGWWSWAHWCWATTWCTPSSTPSSTVMRVNRISVVTNYSNYPTIYSNMYLGPNSLIQYLHLFNFNSWIGEIEKLKLFK